MGNPNEYPAPDELADAEDSDSWSKDRDGHMKDFATSDDTVETEDYDPTQDEDDD